MQRQIPGDPTKSAEGELPSIRLYLRDECGAGVVITGTMLGYLFDLMEEEAAKAIDALIAEGMLVRQPELGPAPIRPATLPEE